ncbi:MAG: hypothetical protein ACK5E6_09010, partial [Cyanobacteriota bacterium]
AGGPRGPPPPPPPPAARGRPVLEAPSGPDTVALLLAGDRGPRRPLLRWWLRWRHLGPECTAAELMAAGVPRGPMLGERLRQGRAARLERERP